MKQGEFKKEIEDIVFKLKPQGISEPVKIENKYYIFRLNNIIPAQQQTLSEVQDRFLTFYLIKRCRKQLTKWLDELKKQSYIKILNE